MAVDSVLYLSGDPDCLQNVWIRDIGGDVSRFRKFAGDQDGSTAIEYALMAAVCGLLIFAGISAFGGSSNGAMAAVMSRVTTALGF